MKYLPFIGFGILILGGIYAKSLDLGTVEVVNYATTTPEKSEEVSIPSEWQKAAENAYNEVIRQKTLEAELEAVQSEIEALRAKETELEKQLGLY